VTRVPKKRVLISYHDELIESLRNDPEEAALYLNEALKDEDPRIFLLALQNAIEANSAKKAH
jgi:DNA-binding phage protein